MYARYSWKTCLLQAKFFDTFDGHTACRVHQKMAIAAGEPDIPAMQGTDLYNIEYWGIYITNIIDPQHPYRNETVLYMYAPHKVL